MSTQTPEIKYVLNDDRSKVTINMNGSEVSFTTKEFESLLGWFGLIRAQMTPTVPLEVKEGMQVSQVSNVFLGHRKDTTGVPAESGMVIAARSEMFGWLEFTADPEFCRGMIAWMSSSGQAADVQPTAPPVN